MFRRNKYNKYSNTRCVDEKYDTGTKFDSLHERQVWYDLRALEDQGTLEIIQLQKTFTFRVNGIKICAMRADFIISYEDELYVLDAKSDATQGRLFQIKKDLLLALHKLKCYSVTKKHNILDVIDEIIQDKNL
jgi:protein associated with RNAse G/E